jgi:hypothetical protein
MPLMIKAWKSTKGEHVNRAAQLRECSLANAPFGMLTKTLKKNINQVFGSIKASRNWSFLNVLFWKKR